MSELDALVTRIRGEYEEMPGLQLTCAQACRLWQLDRATCEAVFQILVNEGFLRLTDRGFISSPGPAARVAVSRTSVRRQGA